MEWTLSLYLLLNHQSLPFCATRNSVEQPRPTILPPWAFTSAHMTSYGVVLDAANALRRTWDSPLIEAVAAPSRALATYGLRPSSVSMSPN